MRETKIIISFLSLAAVLILILSSVAVIWSINTIFNLGLSFSVKTILATMILIYVFGSHGKDSK